VHIQPQTQIYGSSGGADLETQDRSKQHNQKSGLPQKNGPRDASPKWAGGGRKVSESGAPVRVEGKKQQNKKRMMYKGGEREEEKYNKEKTRQHRSLPQYGHFRKPNKSLKRLTTKKGIPRIQLLSYLQRGE